MYAADSIVIHRPPGDVFRFVADVRNFARWVHDTEVPEAELTPQIVGSTWYQVSHTSGIALRFRGVVLEAAPPRRLSYRCNTAVSTNLVHIDFVDLDGRTRVDTEWHMDGTTWYLRALYWLLSHKRFEDRMRHESRLNLAGLQRALEPRPGDASS